jgi:hypothetical protein
MRPLTRLLIAVALLLSLTAAVAAQAGRLPIPVEIPVELPVGPDLPIHGGPHPPGPAGGDSEHNGIYILLGLGGLALYCVISAGREQPSTSEPAPDLIHSAEKVAPKAGRTRRLMELLARRDRLFDPTALRGWAENSFLRVQECWQQGDYGPLGDLLLPQIRVLHESQLAELRAAGLRNVLGGLRVVRLEFVHLDCPADPAQQQVTALITFRAASSYVDTGTGAFRQGSQVPVLFQEFWVFRRQGDAWHLDGIERNYVSDFLTRPNRVEGLSEEQFRHAEECAAP